MLVWYANCTQDWCVQDRKVFFLYLDPRPEKFYFRFSKLVMHSCGYASVQREDESGCSVINIQWENITCNDEIDCV